MLLWDRPSLEKKSCQNVEQQPNLKHPAKWNICLEGNTSWRTLRRGHIAPCRYFSTRFASRNLLWSRHLLKFPIGLRHRRKASPGRTDGLRHSKKDGHDSLAECQKYGGFESSLHCGA